MQIVFIGPPGAGKGTQSVRLAKHLGVPHLSTGDMLREACEQKSGVGLQAAVAMEAGQLVSDELVQEVVLERIEKPDCRSGCILDGFPRTLPQAEALDRWLVKRRQPLSVALELQVSQEDILRRLSGRGRQDDTREIAIERLKLYDQLTRPLLDHYSERSILRGIDGSGDEDDVFGRILKVVDDLKSGE